jgi:catechol 2,3-dioxygenase-like lactoylglutathione lyase family enzyme
MLGRFLELGLSTSDIAASLGFYEQLGFSQLNCTDPWPHPYCVLSDGRLCVGLHQRAAGPATLTFVHSGLSAHASILQQHGLPPGASHLGFEDFHRLQLQSDTGQALLLLEARTFSPPAGPRASLCGYWSAWSMPVPDLTAAAAFWERAGCIAHAEEALPFAHVPVTADYLSLALHQRSTLPWPALVYTGEAMADTLELLQARGIDTGHGLPAALDPACNGLLTAPEGTRLLLLQGEY